MRRLILCAVLVGLIAGNLLALGPNDILPPSKIRPGMKGYGLSVFRGTQIERFPITVLGVLERSDFDMDAILIRIDGGTVVQRKSGVIAGMSGSPIFINGKLIGAISFGWYFPKEPICGVTPITAMLACTEPQKFPSPKLTTGVMRPKGSPIIVGGKSIHRVWVAANMKEAEAIKERLRPDEGLLVPVATPLLVSGVPRSVLPLLQRMLEPYNVVVMEGASGKATSLPVKDAPIRPGSALGVQVVGGDVDFTAIGTVTWVEGDKVWAFGHSMMELGSVDLPITSAYVLDILPSYQFSFKLAVSLKERGRLTQDRLFAVAGELGKPAQKVPMQVTVRNFAQKLQRHYDLQLASHRELVRLGAYISLLGALTSAVSSSEEGSTYMRLRVEAKDLPTIERENWFPAEGGMGTSGIIFILLGGARTSPLAELADIVEAATGNRFGEVKFTRIQTEIEFHPQRRTAWIDRVTARKTRVKPGEKVPVTLTLKGWGGFERTMTVDLEVPQNARPGRIRFLVGGGMMGETVRQQSGYRRPRPRSLRELWEQLRDVYANNEVIIATSPLTSGVEIAGKRWESLPSSTIEALLSMGSSDIQSIRDYREKRFPFDRILTGMASIVLTVETEEREKEAPPRMPMMEAPPPPGPSGPSGPPQSPEGGEEEMTALILQRLLTLPLIQQLRDPIERAWLEIQTIRQKWRDEEGFVRWLVSLAPFTMQREEKLDKEQPPQPPNWEEVRRLSPEQPERKEQPAQPQQPSAPTQPTARTQPLARQPKTWVLDKGEDWLRGKLDGTVVATDGTVTLGYHAKTLYNPEETVGAFCLLPSSGNSLLVGTIGPARLIKVDADGRKEVVAEISDEAAVTAIAKAPDNSVWFATAPSGKVFRLAPDSEKPEQICSVNATVWAIAFFDDGTAVLATGPEGKVLTIPKGAKEPKLLVQLPDRHALALAKGIDGSIFVGTTPRGKVYKLSPDGKVETVFEAPQNPVQTLAVDKKGNLYVGTSGSAIVYLVAPDGSWKELRRFTPERHIMAMVGLDDGVIVATGSPGKLYRLTSDGVAAWLYDSEQIHLLSVAVNGDTICVIPSGSGEVVALHRNSEGIYRSPILDAGQIARWGVLRFIADVPEGAQVLVQARSGNTAYPDSTWSDWTPPVSTSETPLTCPPARYLQLRFLLRTNDTQKAPVLKRVSVVYFPKNQPPKLTVQEPAAGAVLSGKVTIRWRGEDPDRDRLSYEVFYSSDSGKTWHQIREGTTQPAQPQQQKQEEKQKGQESKPESQPQQTQPTGATTASSINWDTTKVPDGVYWLKVIASDRISNPDDPQTAEQIIAPVIVDNTPPTLGTHAVKREGNKLLVPAYDNIAVGSAEYRAEGGEWIAATCQDGVFDQPYEVLVIDLGKLMANVKVVEVRVRDSAGNERVVKLNVP
jgi:outer membrane protein assembly factor BamB